MYSLNHNKPKSSQTATPSKYPQGHFKDKKCKCCNLVFKPKSPAELYCSDRCKDRGIQTAYLMRSYGITLDDYEEMLESQKGLCKICGTEGFAMNPKVHKIKLVVDHCHTKGNVRGLLCHNCNRALGLLKDNVKSLQAAIEYLNV
ncbi:endonuclease VII [Yersinia phage YpP-G]|uniref:Endonuclease VII n=2 Tax=root TaxID=1 RepID=I6Q9Z6_9CAUD|nr:endonuclease VII [Yersinia phage YpP-G]